MIVASSAPRAATSKEDVSFSGGGEQMASERESPPAEPTPPSHKTAQSPPAAESPNKDDGHKAMKSMDSAKQKPPSSDVVDEKDDD